MEGDIARHRSLLVLCASLSLVAGGLIGFFTPHPQGPSISVLTPDPSPTPQPPAPLRVYVSGAVVAPAVYRLAPGSLVEDAIQMAGGAAAEADLEQINLALELADQQQVYVPWAGVEEIATPVPTGGVATVSLLNVNTASAAELETLPHIGPTTAQRIVEYRETYGPFESTEELLDVTGIGEATFAEIKDLVTVGE